MKKKQRLSCRIIIVILTVAMMITFVPWMSMEARAESVSDVSNRLNQLVSQYSGQTSWPSSYGAQCYSFAHFVFNTVYGRTGTVGSYSSGTEYKFNSPASDVEIVGQLSPGYTDAQLEALLDKALPGDFVQLKRRSSGGPHSEIVLSVDAENNNITIFDANSGSVRNQVRTYTQNYFNNGSVTSFRNWNQAVTIYRKKGYPDTPIGHNPEGCVDSVTGGNGTVTVRGWAFDRDNTKASLQIHVYVGGPTGSGVPSYGITANCDSTDVNNAYGITGAHCFSATIDIPSIVGNKTIYIYAINVGEGDNVFIGQGTTNILPVNITQKNLRFTGENINSNGNAYSVTGLTSEAKGYISIPCTVNGIMVQRIAREVFKNNEQVNAVYIQDGCYRLGGECFMNAKNLESIRIPDSITEIGADVFNGCESLKYIFYAGTEAEWREHLSQDSRKQITNTGAVICFENNFQYNIPGTNAQLSISLEEAGLCITDCNKDVTGDITIPAEIYGMKVNRVALHAFDGCSNLTGIILPEGITRVGQYGFANCSSLNKIILPGSVRSLGVSICSGSNSLEKILYMGSKNEWDNIIVDGDGLGASCTVIPEYKRASMSGQSVLDGDYHIVSGYNKSYGLDITGGSGDNDTNVQLYANVDDNKQVFHIEWLGDGYYKITSKKSGLSLDVQNADTVKGTNVQMHNDNGTIAQRWIIEDSGDGVDYYIYSVCNGLAVDIESAVVENGTNIQTWTPNKSSAQKWRFVKTQDEPAIEKHVLTKIEVKNATCTDDGNIAHYHCSVCGKFFADENAEKELQENMLVIPATGNHTWDVGKVTRNATCTAAGVRTYTCTICGETKTEAIPATGHSVVEDLAKEATCTEPGMTKGSHCSICGTVLEQQNVVPPFGHVFGEWKVEKNPTETDAGLKVRTCDRCGTRETSVIGKLEHVHTIVVDLAVDPSCTENGLTEGKHCSECGEVIVAQQIIPAPGHRYGEWTVTKKATCAETGVETRICNNDVSHKETRSIPVDITNHTGKTMVKNAKEATCGIDGYTGDVYCADCNTLLRNGNVIPRTGNHLWDAGKITKAATEQAEGMITYTCTVCGEQKTELIPKTPHTHVLTKTNARAATCMTEGNIEYWTCAACGKIYTSSLANAEVSKADTVIPATGHKYGEWTVTKEASAMSDGERTLSCTVCGYTKTEKIPAIKIADGWQKIDNKWYLYKNNAALIGWQKSGGIWYYMDGNGIMLTGWQKISGTWYYFNGSGAMVTGWMKSGNVWYYFNGSGAMVTGWMKSGNVWYYFNGSGAMVTGWMKSGNIWYYFNGSGAMVTGWMKSGNVWYYFNGSGAMVTGWMKSGNIWYYFNGSGAMCTGWQKVGNIWYYFEESGAMAAGKWIGNYYMTSSGAMAMNTWIGRYYVGADGKWIPNYK